MLWPKHPSSRFSRQGALGQHLHAVTNDGRDRPEPAVTIVGIVPDVRQETLLLLSLLLIVIIRGSGDMSIDCWLSAILSENAR